MRISKLADYAVVILAEMGRCGSAQMSSAALAERVHIPEPTVSKILKILVRAQILTSMRGMRGGYSLVRSISEISVHDVVVAFEGEISVTSCAKGGQTDCSIAHTCGSRGRWNQVNLAIKQALENVSLADMVCASVEVNENSKDLKYGRN